MTLWKNLNTNLLFASCLVLLAGCLEMGGGEVDEGTTGGTEGNQAPVISGTPPVEARVGQNYAFTPNATDPEGDPLSFSVANLPGWAEFDSRNGRISGTPTLGTEGMYSNIQITVSDGDKSASTPQFSVQVTQNSMGSATLSWNPPSMNTDGTPLTDLAGFKIYYGTSQGSYPNQVRIDNPGITTYVVDNLPPNTYYFVSTAINSNGMESDFSNVATKIVN